MRQLFVIFLFCTGTCCLTTAQTNCTTVTEAGIFTSGQYDPENQEGKARECFSFPNSCGAVIKLNTNKVADVVEFEHEGRTSGRIGAGVVWHQSIINLPVGACDTLPFEFDLDKVYKGPIKVTVRKDFIVVCKIPGANKGYAEFDIYLVDFTAVINSNIQRETVWDMYCAPKLFCTTSQAPTYILPCPQEDVVLVSPCSGSGFEVVWTAPDGLILGNTDTIVLYASVELGEYIWQTSCQSGIVFLLGPEEVSITKTPVLCSDKQRLSLPFRLKGRWSDGSFGNSIIVEESGTYSVAVGACGYVFTTDVQVVSNSFELDVWIEPDTDTVLLGNQMQFTANSNDSRTSFKWFKNGERVTKIKGAGLYMVEGSLDDCIAFDTILVLDKLFENCGLKYYAPNAFSPDGDGINDHFFIYPQERTEVFFEIYTRWGERVFEGTEHIGWDGTFNGQPMNTGVYVWRASVFRNFEQCSSLSGDVTLVR